MVDFTVLILTCREVLCRFRIVPGITLVNRGAGSSITQARPTGDQLEAGRRPLARCIGQLEERRPPRMIAHGRVAPICQPRSLTVVAPKATAD